MFLHHRQLFALLVFVERIVDAYALALSPNQHNRQEPLPIARTYQVSQEILEGLHSSVGSSENLDLERDFYDESTGLYSEGVWHNCMGGIAALQSSHLRAAHQSSSSSRQQQQRYSADAQRIAASLFRYSWDGTSFRRRSWSGKWDHSKLLSIRDTDVAQPNYYVESSEHRCIQHAIALAFWSMLSRDNEESSTSTIILSQQTLILDQFIKEFWDGKRWTTISQSQGSGTTLRPSASSGIAKTDDAASSSSSVGGAYFRGVDQAVAILALLEHIKLLDDNKKNTNTHNNEDERDRIIHLIETSCKVLLDEEDGFGYNNLQNAQTYLGMKRNQNFWHEGWVMLALSSARDYINIWPMDARDGHLKMIWSGLMERYTATDGNTRGGTIWHWPLSQKDVNSGNVRYCGDNVLAFAIRRSLRISPPDSDGDEDDNDVAFWKFIEELRSPNNPYQLASVADAYKQVRLHPNTELAALLVWP